MRVGALALAMLCGGALAAESAAVSVGEDNVGAIHGRHRVAIGEFDVEFLTQIYAHDRANHGAFGTSSAMITATLDGIGDSAMQAVTDQAYADTVAALKAAGFEVVDAAQLAANADWQAQAEQYGQASPYAFSDSSLGDKSPQLSRIFAPTGGKAYFASAGKGRGSFSQRSAAQNASRGMKAAEIAKALDAELVNVHYLASFGLTSQPKRGWGMLAGSFAKASITPAAVLLPDETQWQLNSPDGARLFTTSTRTRFNGAVYLDDAALAASSPITLTENTSATDRHNDNVTNVIGILAGTGTQKTKGFVARADSEDAWRAAYQQLIADSAKAFAHSLAAAQ